ncbi:MAG: acyl-CoA dehydrogenase domain protein [Frankiales bacterium]|jgi:alkylation response protein AidB-like acyl-CoA dehydrogenase|nr:acyl-CoA dehydrogenase domain protein [Frankiales bacterium]
MTDLATDVDAVNDVEDLESFRSRLRAWLKDNMPAEVPRTAVRGALSDEEELADVQRNRDLQRKLYDGGFAGIVFPKEYGGAGLTPAHQAVFNSEIVGYQFPDRTQVPTFTPCAAVILEFGTEEQKRQHLPAIMKGEEIWMQMLSEPGSGSDVAGATTTAVRDGEMWVVNGSKIWTTGAWWSDWALALVRTNWDVPKHRGMSVFMVKIHQPGIEVNRIEMLNGAMEFCQEFMTDLHIPDSDRIGEVDAGWTVGTKWMYYEKSFNISPFITRPAGRSTEGGGSSHSPVAVARRTGRLEDPVVRQLIGESHSLSLVNKEAGARIGRAISGGHFNTQAAGLARILGGVTATQLATLNFELAGAAGVVWDEDDEELGALGVNFLVRQSSQIGGGTTEMSRNVVSERFLGMPSEARNDRDMAFRDVPRGGRR